MKYYDQQKGLYCLNKGWRFSDCDFSVLPDQRTHDAVYEYTKAGRAKGPAESCFDDSQWQQVELPHDWVAHRQFQDGAIVNHGSKERGCGWYRIRFCLDEEDKDKQLLLEFEGLSSDAYIYVNGLLMKRSFSGYNSFCVDISEIAHFGLRPNVLAIRIDASAWEGWWYEGAGIYRNVWLLKKSSTHIAYQGVFLKPEKAGDQWYLLVETKLENSFAQDRKVVLQHQIFAPDGREVTSILENITVACRSEQQSTVKVNIPDACLWDLDAPQLYRVRSCVIYDEQEQDFQVNTTGLRTIRFDANSGFWLNERNLKIKGFCNHQDHAGVGVAVPFNVKEYRIRKLLESGANAYRCAHNPDPEILEICDRLGMLVMEENRLFSTEPDNLVGLDGLVKNARNHPCVIMYSIGNEEYLFGTENGRRIAETMYQRVKRLDDTRPVTAAFSSGFLEDAGVVHAVDIVGLNYNDRWYDVFRQKYPEKLVCGSETASAFSVRGVYETDKDAHLIDNYDQEAAMWGSTVRKMWKDIDSRPYMIGTFVWTGFDYRGEPTPFTWPSVASYFGAWDSCGYEKDAVYLYKALWTAVPMVHITSPWTDEENIGKEITVMAVTNCDHVRLLANGKVIVETDVDRYAQFSCQLLCERGELVAEGYRNSICVAKDVQQTAGRKAVIHVAAEETQLSDPVDSAAIFHVSILDENGNLAPVANDHLQFEVENGTIIGVGNGDPNSHELDVANDRRAFHGRVQVIVRPSGVGNVRLIATAVNLKPGAATVTVMGNSMIPEILPVTERVIDGWRFFHRIFEKKPSAVTCLDSCDMNSYLPVVFGNQPQPELLFQTDKYGLYVVSYDFDSHVKHTSLYFQQINGEVWIYLDDTEIACRTGDFYGSIEAKLPPNLAGWHLITVIIRNSDHAYPFAGIYSPVFYREEKKGNNHEQSNL